MRPAAEPADRECEQSGELTLSLPVRRTWCDESGEWWFEGVASSTGLDRQRERMSRRALAAVASRLAREDGGVRLLSSHPGGGGRRAPEELGQVEECLAGPDELLVKGRLNRGSPAAEQLHRDLCGGRPFGLSVGGRVKQAHWEMDDEAHDLVRVIDEVELDHIAVCSPEHAVNARTCLRVAEGGGGVGDDRDGEERRAPGGLRERVMAGLRWLHGKGASGASERPIPAGECAESAVDEALAELAEMGSELQHLSAELDASGVAARGSAKQPKADQVAVAEHDEEGPVEVRRVPEVGHAVRNGMLQPARGDDAVRGRRRSLEGQERTVGRGPIGRVNSEPVWKGVL